MHMLDKKFFYAFTDSMADAKIKHNYEIMHIINANRAICIMGCLVQKLSYTIFT